MTVPSPPTRRVFISYASADDRLAVWMVDYLEQAGIACWFAPRQIEVGEDFAQKLREAIARSYAVLVFVTEAADASPHVERELALAVRTKRPLLPLLLAGFKPDRLDYWLATVHHLVLEDRAAVSPSLAQQVCSRLRELAAQDLKTPTPTEAETRTLAREIAEPSDATLWRVYASSRSRLVLVASYVLAMLMPVLVPGSIGPGLEALALLAGTTLVVATRRLNFPALFTFGFVQPVFMVLPVAVHSPRFVLQSVYRDPPWQYGILWAAGGLVASLFFGSIKRHSFSFGAWRAWIAPHWAVLRPIERVEAVVNVMVLATGIALMAFSLW